jgi:hypothetical protein
MFKMDPIDLSEEDLDYELHIRNITKIMTHREKTKVLAENWEREQKNLQPAPSGLLRATVPEDELQICREKLQHLTNNRGLLSDTAFRTRLLGLKDRVERLKCFCKPGEFQNRVINVLEHVKELGEEDLSDRLFRVENIPPTKEATSKGAMSTLENLGTGAIPKHSAEANVTQRVGKESHIEQVCNNPVTNQMAQLRNFLANNPGPVFQPNNQQPPPNFFQPKITDFHEFTHSFKPQSHNIPVRQPWANTELAQTQQPVPFASQKKSHSKTVMGWKLSYGGENNPNGLNLFEFLAKIEMYAKADNLSEQDLLDSAGFLFEKDVAVWYSSAYQNYTEWKSLVRDLKRFFLKPVNDFQVLREIHSRRQSETEPFCVFLARLELIFKKLSYAPTEAQKIAMVRDNMLPFYIKQLSLITVNSITELTNYCTLLEQTRFHLSQLNSPNPTQTQQSSEIFELSTQRPTVNSIPSQRPNWNSQVNSNNRQNFSWNPNRNFRQNNSSQPTPSGASNNLNRQNYSQEDNVAHQSNSSHQNQNRPRNSIRCWKCDRPGHTYRNCRSSIHAIFCTVCGRKGVTVDDCSHNFQTQSPNISIPSTSNAQNPSSNPFL